MIRQLLPAVSEVAGPADLEDIYAPPYHRHLRANFVVSIDGAVELGGRSKLLGGPPDRAAFLAMRALADAVMVGAGTARVERYGPVTLDEQATARRINRGQQPLPPLVLVSRRGDLGAGERVFSGGSRPILLTTARAIRDRPELADLAEVIECGHEEVNLVAALDALAARGLRRVLCEGGPSLFGSLLGSGLVDELCISFSPLVAGAGPIRLSGDVPLAGPVRFRLAGLLEGDGMLIARYERPPTGRGER